jgi:hypothetical protein
MEMHADVVPSLHGGIAYVVPVSSFENPILISGWVVAMTPTTPCPWKAS